MNPIRLCLLLSLLAGCGGGSSDPAPTTQTPTTPNPPGSGGGGGGGGGGGTNPPNPPTTPALGTVTDIGGCQASVGPIPNTTCRRLRISDPVNSTVDVELRITEPQTLPVRGTILFGSGGPGTDFYQNQAGGDTIVETMADLGFRVIDRKWIPGWYVTTPYVKEQSRRYAILSRWVHDNLHTDGPFLACGNSAGGAEIAYALNTWDCDDFLDGAVMAGGPPMARLDYLCDFPSPPAWPPLCASVVPPGAFACGAPECVNSPTHSLCQSLVSGPPVNTVEESLLHSGAIFDFPTTPVRVLMGDEDCTVGPPQGLLFFNQVTSNKNIEFVAGAVHFMPTTEGGRDSLEATLLSIAQTTALEVTQWPHAGQHIALEVRGEPGAAYELFAVAGHGPHPETPEQSLANGFLDPVTGRTLVVLDVPASMAGLTLTHRVVTNGIGDELLRTTVLPGR